MATSTLLMSSSDFGIPCSIFLATKGGFSDLTAHEETEFTAVSVTKSVKDEDSEGNRP